MGTADVLYRKRRGAATIIFGEKGDFPLLGVTALEALGLIFDPIHRKFKAVALTIGLSFLLASFGKFHLY